MMIITPNRVRTIVADCKTLADIQVSLRHHKIKCKYTTETGYLSMIIPTATGNVRVYQTCSKSNPFRIALAKPVPYRWPK